MSRKGHKNRVSGLILLDAGTAPRYASWVPIKSLIFHIKEPTRRARQHAKQETVGVGNRRSIRNPLRPRAAGGSSQGRGGCSGLGGRALRQGVSRVDRPEERQRADA